MESKIVNNGIEKLGNGIEKLSNKIEKVGIFLADELITKVERFIEKVITSTPVDFLTYREMLNMVIENKPNVRDFSKAAVVKRVINRDIGKKYKFTIVYLNQNNKTQIACVRNRH